MRLILLCLLIVAGCGPSKSNLSPSDRVATFIVDFEKWQSKNLGPENQEFMQVLKVINREVFYGHAVKVAIFIDSDSDVKALHDSLWSLYAHNILGSYNFGQADFTGVQVVDRKSLSAILSEHHLSYSGILEKSAPEVGQILGTTHLLFADWSYVDEGFTNESAKLLETKNGRVLATYSKVHKTK